MAFSVTVIETGALDKALRALKLSGMLDTLERAGIRYVQVSLDDADMYSDHALEQDVTNLRQAATTRCGTRESAFTMMQPRQPIRCSRR